ncbi:hypothetical protein KBD68_02650 [Candidatus Woesebacteria bacterium]|jgi:hypothetical protein|nr:hypothetical protein [Candidatus Woesebacteria bacterium]
MAQNINLLPVELSRGKEVNALLSKLKVASIIVCTILLLTSMAGLAYVVLTKKAVDEMVVTRDKVKAEVLTLEASERRLVLLKDRLTKIIDFRNADVSRPQLENQKKVIDVLPEEVTIIGARIDGGEAKIGLSSATLPPLTLVIQRLVSEKLVSQLALSNVAYNPVGGYQVYIDFNK